MYRVTYNYELLSCTPRASPVGVLRLNCIQTDHKAVMGRVETSLHALHEVGLPMLLVSCAYYRKEVVAYLI